MKTVICCLNSKYIHSSLAPWCLKAGVREYCNDIDCEIVESTINAELNLPYLEILEHKPTVVGFCSYIWNIDKTLELCRKIKAANEKIITVLGGPEVAYRVKEVLAEYSFVDYIISGEGERPFALLCNALYQGKTVDIKGVSRRFKTSLPNVESSDPPSPYCDEFLCSLNGRISYIETSRGCPFNCAFCLSGRCGGVRFFDMEKTKQNIIKLGNANTKTVKFVDRTFNAKSERAKEIWRFIIENYATKISKEVCFHFEIAGDILDSESIEILNSAPKGLFQLEIGMQSFSEKTLCAINRKTNTEKLKENIKALIKPRNMHIHIDLIVGLPYEGLESFKESFNTAFSLGADMLQVGFLKLLYGAPMRENPDEFPCEYEKDAPYTVTKTPWLNEAEIASLKNMEDCFDRIYCSGRFKETLKYLVNTLKTDPFELFFKLGNGLNSPKNISLNGYFTAVYEYFKGNSRVDIDVLRDVMAADKLMCDKGGKLPLCLKVSDANLKSAKRYVRQRLGATASATIIYTDIAASQLGGNAPLVLGVDYNDKDKITNRFKAHTFTNI